MLEVCNLSIALTPGMHAGSVIETGILRSLDASHLRQLCMHRIFYCCFSYLDARASRPLLSVDASDAPSLYQSDHQDLRSEM